MEIGEIMNLNWNRMSLLSRLQNKNEIQKAEWDMRIAFQNYFANAKTDEEREVITKYVEETLDEKMIKPIRSYLKKKN